MSEIKVLAKTILWQAIPGREQQVPRPQLGVCLGYSKMNQELEGECGWNWPTRERVIGENLKI